MSTIQLIRSILAIRLTLDYSIRPALSQIPNNSDD